MIALAMPSLLLTGKNKPLTNKPHIAAFLLPKSIAHNLIVSELIVSII